MGPRTLASLLLTGCCCVAQSAAIPFPLAVAGSSPGGPLRSLDNRTFASPASRSQLLYDVAAVPVPAAVWSSLQFRMPTAFTLNLAYMANVTVALGMSSAPPAAASPTFASNVQSPSTVISMLLSLPVRFPTTTWPMAWEAPVPFTVPYVYSATTGQALVVDVVQTATFGSGWSLEAWTKNNGQAELGLTVQPACKFGSGFFAGNPTFPLLSNASGVCYWPSLPIPNLPSLAGRSFFEQVVFVDTAANALGLVPLPASRWIVGSGRGGPGATVITNAPAASSGTVYPEVLPSLLSK